MFTYDNFIYAFNEYIKNFFNLKKKEKSSFSPSNFDFILDYILLMS